MSYSRANFILTIIVSAAVHIAQTPVSSSVGVEALIRQKYKVHITNGFKSNEKPLIIHCYSNDDDLGEHTLWMKGKFSFGFGIHMITPTHFWCDMQWGSKKKKGVNVFTMGDEYSFCFHTGNCFWLVKEEGFFLSEDNKKWEKRYYWPFDV